MNTTYLPRILILAGFAIGLKSLAMTLGHVADPAYTLVSAFTKGSTHAWYHAFREGIGDIAAMAVILMIFFGPGSWRSPVTWFICLILMGGYYLPFWIGTPFVPELAAPHWRAEFIHMAMAAFSFSGLIFAGKEFFSRSAGTASKRDKKNTWA